MQVTDNKVYNRVLTAAITVTSIQLMLSKYQAKAPYGKYGGGKASGVSLDPRFGWWLMELPATVMFLYQFSKGRANKAKKEEKDPEEKKKGPSKLVATILFLVWCRHYGNRGWFFPLSIRVAQGSKESFALFNSAIGCLFIATHGYLNGRMFSEYGKHYTDSWLTDPRFVLGWMIYEAGFWITVHSEHVMRELRPKNGIVSPAERYKIPMGGMYEYVTNAPYFGELMAWTGFVVMTWSPSALPVLLISLANLVPRAAEQQKWYHKKFPNYPKDRKILIPFIY